MAFTLEPQKCKVQILLLKTAVKNNKISPSEQRALRYLLGKQKQLTWETHPWRRLLDVSPERKFKDSRLQD